MKQSYPAAKEDVLPHVVILGAGFAGLTAAKSLAKVRCRVTVIDRRNYHLFQPLLYQVATAALSPADIATPIRSILRKQRNAAVLMGRVQGIDRQRRVVTVDQDEIAYDQLIVATGARHGYFGHDDWEAVAPGLKKIDDATQIRRRLLLAFEQAESTSDQNLRKALLTFVVIGGGPTGVELAGAVAELARQALVDDFRKIDPSQARVLLVEAGPRLLAAFPESLSAAAAEALTRLGVEVLLGQAVTDCTEDGVRLGNIDIPSRSLIWAAGVAASPAARWLGCEKDRSGRVIVGPDLTLPGAAEIFVIGDTASVVSDGKPVPGLAPAAKQMGVYVAKVLAARISGKTPPPAFRYRHLGSLATIGRQEAVADFGWLRLRGRLAWFLWGIVHVAFLIGVRSRTLVALQWLWAYATYQRGARLITSPAATAD
ncbi:NAD(P)/FAD-dependent oxidoreductase [Dongia sp.]|uniref:NAD(P)/FAD-dependent oxidoreductase n=1 Tax=Dongia sp. TaxID=1977262 RepID=UPI0035B0F4DF